MTEACRDRRGSLAVAAMGRLEPAEESVLDAHVDQCDACRSDLRELTAVVRALEHADADRVSSAEQPRPELRQEVLARVASERAARLHRRRLGLAAAAAALIALVVAGVVVWAMQHTGEVPAEAVAMKPAPGVVTEARATAILEPRPWGTQIHLELAGLEPGTEFEVWLLRLDDSRVPAGTFVVPPRGTMQVVAAAGLPPDQAQGVGLSTEADPLLYGHIRDPD